MIPDEVEKREKNGKLYKRVNATSKKLGTLATTHAQARIVAPGCSAIPVG